MEHEMKKFLKFHYLSWHQLLGVHVNITYQTTSLRAVFVFTSLKIVLLLLEIDLPALWNY